MRTSAKRLASCAMTAALSVVLMVLGAVLELGMYACPLFVGLCFIPVGQKYGRKYQIIVYAVSSILCFLLVPNVEQNLMLAGLFGWYPILRPGLQRLPRWLGWLCKLILFNGTVIAIEWLVMTVLVPEAVGSALLWVLLGLGNVTFVLYDFLISRAAAILGKLAKLL